MLSSSIPGNTLRKRIVIYALYPGGYEYRDRRIGTIDGIIQKSEGKKHHQINRRKKDERKKDTLQDLSGRK